MQYDAITVLENILSRSKRPMGPGIKSKRKKKKEEEHEEEKTSHAVTIELEDSSDDELNEFLKHVPEVGSSSGASSSKALEARNPASRTKILPVGNTIPNDYPVSIQEVEQLFPGFIVMKNNADILNIHKDPSETVIECGAHFSNGSIAINRARLISAILTDSDSIPPHIIEAAGSPIVGYAFDDLILMYLSLLDNKIDDFCTRNPYELTQLEGDPNTGDRDSYGFRNLMFIKKKIVFNMHGQAKKSKLVFPLHKPGHWALVYINFNSKTIEHYDSMYAPIKSGLLEQVKLYIKDSFERQVFPGDDMQGFENRVNDYMKDWKIADYSDRRQYSKRVTPQQDGIDCGYFVMEMAKYLALGWKITTTSPDRKLMSRIRQRCVFELNNDLILQI